MKTINEILSDAKITNRVLAFSVMLLFAALSHAQFSGAFAPANWTITSSNSNGTILTTGAPASITMVSSDGNVGAGWHDWNIVVPQTGQITFSWTYNTVDLPQYDYGQYLINGTAYMFNGFNLFGSTSQASTQPCINVMQGQIFTFRIYSVDNVEGPATVIINNFVFTTGNLTVTPSSPSLCAGNTVALTASGASTFTWSGGITNGTPFSPTASAI